MLEQIKQTADWLFNKTKIKPEVGIILGSGLGGMVNEIDIIHSLSYADIPNSNINDKGATYLYKLNAAGNG